MPTQCKYTINENVYNNAVLYFIKYCNNQYLHATKLNKLLYYFDFISFRDSGQSSTGDKYIHQGYGPVPSMIDEILSQLKMNGVIDASSVSKGGYEMINFKILDNKKLDETVFSDKQKKLLKSICNTFVSWPTEKIVAQTHLEAPWFYSKPYEEVNYNYAHDIEFFK